MSLRVVDDLMVDEVDGTVSFSLDFAVLKNMKGGQEIPPFMREIVRRIILAHRPLNPNLRLRLLHACANAYANAYASTYTYSPAPVRSHLTSTSRPTPTPNPTPTPTPFSTARPVRVAVQGVR